ncbi:KamA family radical SAM protein [Caproicibacter fermentans]|uniref:L-lysine 2,3-aminomutase n=1 Tax=Caproicibacter fermentans TaxID=2576756 RepID=A0A7G8TFR4_9FIRM|nr:KamA family radical SAM protein [Caproicibacter fermentans]
MNSYHNAGPWSGVAAEQWNDWKWQMHNRITTAEQLAKVVPLPDKEQAEIEQCLRRFRMAITPYYASLIDPNQPDSPIRKQAVPSIRELQVDPCDQTDPLCEDRYSPENGLVHRYPDRVLFLLTHQCSMYCRHCTRRRMVGCEDFSLGADDLDKAFGYIERHQEVRDVLLSGGDPFVLSDEWLEKVIQRLRSIPHVEIIRIGTRTPVVLPMRITDHLLSMLKKYQPIWINTHFNHPDEITPDSARACEKIVDAGIPLGNQSVLLRGVNDRRDTLIRLFTGLVQIRVRPYYLYQCDLSSGIGHFRTPVAEGIEIMKQIRGNISGFAVPEFVIDLPGGGGKTPVSMDYILHMDNRETVMENFEGKQYRYPNPLL